MRVLVTGASGFVGRHLLAELSAAGHAPVAFDLQPPPPGGSVPGVQYFQGDITDAAAVRQVVQKTQPEACAHLAGIAFVPKTWQMPAQAFAVNVIGSIHVLEALREVLPLPRVLLVSSAEVYGRPSLARPLLESDPLAPENIYGASKAAAEQIMLVYHRHYQLPTMIARPCNHIGPGQSTHFIVPAFVGQLREIAAGRKPPVMHVGNLESRRAFLDVRDVVQAYRLILENGAAGAIYNIAAREEVSIREIFEQLCRISGVRPEIIVDQRLWRPTDRRPLLDGTRLAQELGWRPRFSLAEALRNIWDMSCASA